MSKTAQTWEFKVPGPLVGHKCSVRAAHGEAFKAFKRTARLFANVAGVPSSLNPKGAYEVKTTIYFTGKAHTDPENIRKALIDGLWERDRRVLYGGYFTFENTGVESVDVVVIRRS